MRIHGIQLRGLTSPTGDHQLVLDPGYTVLRGSGPDAARSLFALIRGLLHPACNEATRLDSRGRAVLTLALRSDGCLIAADFARGRVSLGRVEAGGGPAKAISGDPHEIEAQLASLGLPAAEEFELLHVSGSAGAGGRGTIGPNRAPIYPPAIEASRPGPAPEATAARLEAEGARLLAEHEQRASDLVRERARLETELGAALKGAAVDRVRDETRLRELQLFEDELSELGREHEAALAEIEKHPALAGPPEELETRLRAFRTLATQHDEERAVVEDTRSDLLADRARLRATPRRLLVPIALGSALGIAGGAAGAVGYPVGYVLAGIGIVSLLAALVTTRVVRAKLARIETLLAVLRVRERTSERRFESEGAEVRGIMVAVGVSSPEELGAAARGFAEKLEAVQTRKWRIAELEQVYPPERRAERAHLEQALRSAEEAPAVRAARAALKTCPADVPLPEGPAAAEPAEAAAPAPAPLDADTAVDLFEKPDEEPEPVSESVGPEGLLAAAARLLDRSEAELRARLGPVLPVYLRALSMGVFASARVGEGGGWILRGADRDEQPFTALPDRERELVRLAVQLALLEALAADRRVPLLVGPDLPVRGHAEQRALARAFKRLASVVQVIQIVATSEPWTEQAGKSFDL